MEQQTQQQIAKLVADNERLVPYALRNWARDAEFNEICAAGRIGLIKAARAYKSDRGAFSSLAVRCIRREAFRYKQRFSGMIRLPDSRGLDRGPSVVSLDLPVFSDDNRSCTLVDTIADDDTPDPATRMDTRDRLRLVFRLLRKLSRAQRRACVAVMRGGPLSKNDHFVCRYMRQHSYTPIMREIRSACCGNNHGGCFDVDV